MTPERWEQVDRLLQAALDLDASDRSAFLDQACAGNKDLRREVESLLAVNLPTNDFLSHPVVNSLKGELSTTTAEKIEQSSSLLQPGTILDNRYQIERELGRGGMGVVFLAEDRKLHNKPIVIKVLLGDFSASNDPGQQNIGAWLKQRFQDEIKALSRIDHPGVIHAMDMGELPTGQTYLVMNYVPGKPLRTAITLDGMELKRAARLIHQISQALSAAHEKGVIHRDLKPENILLLDVDGEEQIRLIDFGIAAVRDAISAGLQHTKHIAGTPAYMAPEQLAGQAEAASDIYAMGVIAYELATGKRPFNAASPTQQVALQRAGIRVKPRDLCPDLPEAAEAAILKSLEFDPAKRYQDAREFGKQFSQAIEAVDPLKTNIGVLAQEDAPVQPLSVPDAPPTRRFPYRRRFLIPAVALLAVMLTGALAWQGLFDSKRNSSAPKPPAESPVTAERLLDFSLLWKRSPNGVLLPALANEIVLKKDDEVRFELSSPQNGYLYALENGPPLANGQPSFVAIFPDTGSAAVIANQKVSPKRPLVFDDKSGVETFWLIWSEHGIPELDAVIDYANKSKPWIRDRAEVNRITQYLAAHPATAVEEKNEVSKQTRFKQRGEVLVALVKLQYR